MFCSATNAPSHIYPNSLALEGGNPNYVTMMQNEHNEHFSATPVEIKLQARIEALQNQVTKLHRTWENNTSTDNHELLSKVQVLKDTMNKHSKLLEQSLENLSQLAAENLILREENSPLHTKRNKQRRFRTWVRPMQSLGTPTEGGNATRYAPPLREELTIGINAIG
ncbi:hypothetical protein IGI04_014961 [Brassica rapa subsp. trilocularis]|uniref:NPK1-activating kinesin-like protein C-terminal domain-containing protein n=1 Tax=Brassica rapa subsp. trilocularis TaxID=1813537 RepID=A0ABQ7MNP2_BRACM|nr:hypothetical protein IGI04_014961 [Brassica rapa subsp. trilocularis]